MMADYPTVPADRPHAGAEDAGALTLTLPPAAMPGALDRLDRMLARALPELSRTRIKALIEQGHVEAENGGTLRAASAKVAGGTRLRVRMPEAAPAEQAPEPIQLSILHEDDEVIVINKPAGLVVHPAPGNPTGTLVNALIAHCGPGLAGIGGVARPGIVHRIDKETSGLLVVAKTQRAHASLSEQFAEHTVERRYFALVWGVPRPSSGRIEGAIGRNPIDRKKMAIVTRGGKHAVTHYRVLRGFGDWASAIECRLETGRTHQIRVHMASIGHPLIGDPVYGRADRRRKALAQEPRLAAVLMLERQALHARTLGFRHPATDAWLQFESALPADLLGIETTLEAL